MRASWGPVQQEVTEVFCVSTRREIGRGVRRSSCVTRARAHTVRTDVSYKPIRNPPPNTISPHIYRKEKCPPYAIRRGFVFITAKKKKNKNKSLRPELVTRKFWTRFDRPIFACRLRFLQFVPHRIYQIIIRQI